MKKRSLKGLALNKKTISNLKDIEVVKGGASDSPTTCQVCPVGPIDIPTFDFPTINDSCFSWCRDKCNDF
jgi:hypothetical protein